MDATLEAVCEAYGSTNIVCLKKVHECILRLSFYWYNFMHLEREAFVVGFIVLSCLLLAENIEFIENIPGISQKYHKYTRKKSYI